MLLPGLDTDQAQAVAERIGAALRQSVFHAGGVRFSFTLSAGIFDAHECQGAEALKQADDNL